MRYQQRSILSNGASVADKTGCFRARPTVAADESSLQCSRAATVSWLTAYELVRV